MPEHIYRFSFADDVPLDEVESTLLLAIWATESLHGASQVRLEVAHLIDRERRACVIDGGTEAGRDLARILNGYLVREFGADAVDVSRTAKHQTVSAA